MSSLPAFSLVRFTGRPKERLDIWETRRWQFGLPFKGEQPCAAGIMIFDQVNMKTGCLIYAATLAGTAFEHVDDLPRLHADMVEKIQTAGLLYGKKTPTIWTHYLPALNAVSQPTGPDAYLYSGALGEPLPAVPAALPFARRAVMQVRQALGFGAAFCYRL